ncbi:MAG: hypothetical protein DI538_30400, partial [Azospira oryzae]
KKKLNKPAKILQNERILPYMEDNSTEKRLIKDLLTCALVLISVHVGVSNSHDEFFCNQI